MPQAQEGVALLAQEIEEAIEPCRIFLPSGTGTTALYLQKELSGFEVYTCACVGDEAYLRRQMSELEPDRRHHPTILSRPKKYHFGSLYREFFEIWIELKESTGVTFDLLYDPAGWLTMMSHPELFGKPLLYIHQGGIGGNESMLRRYRRRGYADHPRIRRGV